MQLAVNRPELIKRLVILDISPMAYTVRRHDHIFAGLNAVKAAGVKTRADARERFCWRISRSPRLLTSY